MAQKVTKMIGFRYSEQSHNIVDFEAKFCTTAEIRTKPMSHLCLEKATAIAPVSYRKILSKVS